jgi:hypothetical protein
MQQITKSEIKEALKEYVLRYDSQNAAANTLTGISAATISQVLNNNWELISDPMWNKISKQIGFKLNKLNVAETSVYKKLFSYFGDSKRNPNGIRAIVCNASLGKDVSINRWCIQEDNSYRIDCHRQMTVKILLRDMLKSMGKDSSGTVPEMLDNIVKYIEREDEPVFIINEVDKLRDEVLELFIDLENKLHLKCGIIFLATPFLKKRIELGVARSKRGFAELYSRLKKMFFDVTPDKREFMRDVQLICNVNGISKAETIAYMLNKTENDFRVLSDLIAAFKQQ